MKTYLWVLGLVCLFTLTACHSQRDSAHMSLPEMRGRLQAMRVRQAEAQVRAARTPEEIRQANENLREAWRETAPTRPQGYHIRPDYDGGYTVTPQ